MNKGRPKTIFFIKSLLTMGDQKKFVAILAAILIIFGFRGYKLGPS
jgi:hypothetical protein